MSDYVLIDEQATLEFGAKIAQLLKKESEFILFLSGPLGAGKTTLTRGFLRGLGYLDKVKSPTYTLVEPYYIDTRAVYHFDFYRVHHEDEVTEIGIRDYFSGSAFCIIEWPEKVQNLLPTPDIVCYLEHHGEGRKLKISSFSELGKVILHKL